MSDRYRLDPVLDSLLHPGELDGLVAGARETGAEELPGLRVRVVGHLAHVEALAARRPGVDLDTARAVATVLATVLDEPARLDARARALLRGAVEYFVLDLDGRSDTGDALGFDDDARVLNAVLRAIGRNDLVVQP